jgi:hypothetical protein
LWKFVAAAMSSSWRFFLSDDALAREPSEAKRQAREYGLGRLFTNAGDEVPHVRCTSPRRGAEDPRYE